MGFGSQVGGGVDPNLIFQIDPREMQRLLKSLNRLVDKEAKKIIKKSINAAMTPILKDARENAKNDARDTGLMYQSLMKRSVKWDRRYGDWVGKIAPKNVTVEKITGIKSRASRRARAEGVITAIRLSERMKRRKTKTENPAKYAHFTEGGTRRGTAEKKWLRKAIASQDRAARTAFRKKFDIELPGAIERSKRA